MRREQIHGPAHMDLVPPLQLLEQTQRALGKLSAVLPIRERIVDIHVQALGEGHPLAIQALTRLTVLAALAAHDPLWELKSNLLHLYGLPIERSVVQAIAAAP